MCSFLTGEEKLPLLSECLVLEHLWETLSACLLELEYTPDHHAVLVLQVSINPPALRFLPSRATSFMFRFAARSRGVLPGAFIVEHFPRAAANHQHGEPRSRPRPRAGFTDIFGQRRHDPTRGHHQHLLGHDTSAAEDLAAGPTQVPQICR